MPDHVIDAVLEIFTWVGFGMAFVVGLIALIAKLADGSWVPVQAVLADDPDGQIARWFAPDGGVGGARLTHEQEQKLAGRETADVFVRLGRNDRLRLTRGSPLVRLLTWLTVGFAALGAVAGAASLLVLFLR